MNIEAMPFDLTVVTVCRNAAAVLPRCIASVQPLYAGPLKVEHLLVDGDSSDGSVELLQKELEAGRITRYISKPDKGLYDAMNTAISMAAGKVIVFINADDEICPEAVPACVEPILQGTAEYSVASAIFVSKRKKVLLQPNLKRTLWRQPYCHQSMFCSTELLRRVGGFNWEHFPIGADTELMRRLYLQEVKCAVVPQIASLFYDGGVSQGSAVLRERYSLMLHFRDAFVQEVQRNPKSMGSVIKHLRRYAVRLFLVEPMPEEEKSRLESFISRLAEQLPVRYRARLVQHLKVQLMWYSMQKMISNNRKLASRQLYCSLTRLFIQILST